KKELIKDFKKGLSRKELATKYNRDLSTINRTLANEENIHGALEMFKNQKRCQATRTNFWDVDVAVSEWLQKMNESGCAVQGVWIREQALIFAMKMGSMTPKLQEDGFKSSMNAMKSSRML
ncbi:hypothetical protein Ciccas_003089, partial [Cichlidogyrus casuarinus]